MVKKFFILAVALATSAAFLTSCGDDDDAPAQITGKYTVTVKPESEPSSVGYKWLTEQIDSLSKVYTNLGADVNEASGKNDDACEALKKLSTAFEKYKETHDCGADSFKVAYKFETSNTEVTNSKEISFVYNSDGYERIISDSTITIKATESFKVTDSLKKTVYLIIKELENTKSIESLDGFRVVKNDTKEFFTTQAFSDIKAKTTENILGDATHEFVLTYTIGVEDKEMIDNFYVIVPIKITKDDKTESIIDYVVNIEIE